MCGISGILATRAGDRALIERAVRAMNARQVRRGPDDEGIASYPLANGGGPSASLRTGEVVLGHRRLSIIDLSSAGHQPMERSIPGGILSITFNGEIYNFRELRAELVARGERFNTETDTEVILTLFAREGVASFSKLRGMFAFALWDSRNQMLYLVRDRYGIKPLYYAATPNQVVFASTVGALAESGLVPAERDPRALIGFLLTGSVPSPWTTLRAVSAVPSGSYLERRVDGTIRTVRYYDPLEAFTRKRDVSFAEATHEVRRLLSDAVGSHLVSDAPLGIFLSGGLDSSAITALAAHGRAKPVTTLSVNFDEPAYSEKLYQDRVAGWLKTDHRESRIRRADFMGELDEALGAMDQPTVDGVNTFFIAGAAKAAGLKAVLSGLGSDEIFFGYPAFRKARALRFVSHLPAALRSLATSHAMLGRRTPKASYLMRGDLIGEYLTVRGLFTPREAATLLGVHEAEVLAVVEDIAASLVPGGHELQVLESLHPADTHSYLELKSYLESQLLKDTDFMAMHHSVEVRVPFLDHPLVEYLASLPADLKFPRGGVNKPLLVEAVRDIVPREVFQRPKMGFTFPFAEWLASVVGEHNAFRPLLATAHGKELLRRFKAGDLHWSRLWAATIASTWQ
ncbi:MAG: asparagine synthase (glutamine-hydrolyzing) [bacterium]|nr:asparagine synthase (glutamine-hydrolyzing) [bacterium]